MEIIEKIVRGLRNPLLVAFYVAAKLSPEFLFNRYIQLARKQGLDKPYFILSFDCDTERDTAVVEEVHNRLLEMGIMPIYAVPGEVLEKKDEVYKRIASTGPEFINHGYKIHTYYDEECNDYKSCFFYDKLSKDEVVEDIKKGHETHVRIFGKAPNGFRTAHFGTFQRHSQLKFLHDNLSRLGYEYSSSTMPFYAFRYGPFKDVGNGLREIPVSGCFDDPLIILDSWGFMIKKFGNRNEEVYKEQMKKIVSWFSERNLPGLLNFYVDPSHVINSNSFFEAILFAKKHITFIDCYKKLSNILS